MLKGNALKAMNKMVRQERSFSDVLVFVDVAKFDELFKRWKGYLAFGQEDTPGRRKQFEDFERRHKATYAPVAVVVGHEGDEKIRIIDGRHRYAALRDAGLKILKVAVPRNHVRPLAKWGVVIGVIRERAA